MTAGATHVGPMLAAYPRVAAFSRRVRTTEGLLELLGAEQMLWRPSFSRAAECQAVVGWGHRGEESCAVEFAHRAGLPYVSVSEGLIGVPRHRGHRLLSLLVDDRGQSGDDTRPSQLESLLARTGEDDLLTDPRLIERARQARRFLVADRLSKLGPLPETVPTWLAEGKRPIACVVDQTFCPERGDLATQRELFGAMVIAAKKDHPDALVILRAVPGQPQDGVLRSDPRWRAERWTTESIDPYAFVEMIDHLYVHSSGLGFEACMAEKHVVCFAAPFYAGWGITDDRLAHPTRARTRSLDELAAAALILCSRYQSPFGRGRVELEDVLCHLRLQRQRYRENRGLSVCIGMQRFRRPVLRRYLKSTDGQVRFVRGLEEATQVPAAETTRWVVWGPERTAELAECASRRRVPLVRVEDGFLRSVGLGSDMSAPGSLVFDTRGIYFDPRTVSDLEHLLMTTTFGPDEIERGRQLRELVVSLGLSKYNPASNRTFCPHARPSQKVILVPGQVNGDASLLCGSPKVTTNDDLVSQVRNREPEAHLVFKPHPDVVAGNRQGALREETAKLCDEIVVNVPVSRCLDSVDAVHTMTSLVGFESLLRHKPTVVYGQPFYGGWGLTEDVFPFERRTRRLSLDELVVAVFIRYPRYYSFKTGSFCSPEDMAYQIHQTTTSRWPLIPPFRLLRRASSMLSLLRDILHVG